ncbi:hypothetical protein A3B45_04260 [Candidatus Daviesbacteria bacterium RIFCSPLOWO2_01_FULL_39_12]|uniref:Tagatose-bisphosphate aldolase n=1 Tax=Candidatus Daviesbacteria bacterium RIFCSPLOWO2_01_FULL_39_12 TaxID=1797785 RepID=A0A1F5KP42_9BACT|nr:MAG: hypothetical protein A3D79_00615 [Candidatus Daviesbacteria bacterium RIFCSPHIGHO2_02_FULL_39_8]OGE42391.1 MAG: hypothetical protein A3B45_04260 [Candidatus Daviesbacteria bacterium RIFCSPLOWO2_01_FULL_39_12]
MTAKEWLQKAKIEKFAIGAFNVSNLEVFKAIAQAAANKKSPVIIESSPGETKWMEAENVVDISRNFSDEYKIPILVNLDHAETLAQCQIGIEAGYDLIHFDGGKMSYEENLQIAKQVVELAHARDLTVEGEIDHIGGSSTVHQGSASEEVTKVPMTDPQKAAQFVKASGVDIFAAFFGNVHGLYQSEGKHLDMDRLKQIADLIPDTYLSLHGGSGEPDDQVRAAIQFGVVKININTEMRQAFKDTLEKVIEQNPDEYAMYKVEGPVLEAVQKIVEQKMAVFGSAGKA